MGGAEEQELQIPFTISRSTATLSHARVGRASGKVQTDLEPFNLGTLQHLALAFLIGVGHLKLA
jgi:hypothetical protein